MYFPTAGIECSCSFAGTGCFLFTHGRRFRRVSLLPFQMSGVGLRQPHAVSATNQFFNVLAFTLPGSGATGAKAVCSGP